jgi:hypothetical protein
MRKFRTESEMQVGVEIAEIFERSPDSTEVKLESFPRYVRRQQLKRFLALYEIFKLSMPVKGSVVECGVFRGFGLMSWAKLSAMLEPENFMRRIYGFDSFSGFPAISSRDENSIVKLSKGGLGADSFDELKSLIEQFDRDRFLGHMDKVHLIKGDVAKTIPKFIRQNRHLVISLLFLDMDLYEPTRCALKHFVPRMPRGAILAFDELDNKMWPGETLALLDEIGIGKLELRRLEFDPYISFAKIP